MPCKIRQYCGSTPTDYGIQIYYCPGGRNHVGGAEQRFAINAHCGSGVDLPSSMQYTPSTSSALHASNDEYQLPIVGEVDTVASPHRRGRRRPQPSSTLSPEARKIAWSPKLSIRVHLYGVVDRGPARKPGSMGCRGAGSAACSEPPTSCHHQQPVAVRWCNEYEINFDLLTKNRNKTDSERNNDC